MARYFVAYLNSSTGRWEGINANDADMAFDAASGSGANVAAYTQSGRPGKYAAFAIDGGATASLIVGTGNAAVNYTALGSGTLGNQIQIRYVVAGNNTPLTVSVTGRDITVNVATGAGGAPTSTGSQVMAAVNAHATASLMVQGVLPLGSDGTGVVAAQAFTFLAGGTAGAAVIEDLQPSNIPVSTPGTW